MERFKKLKEGKSGLVKCAAVCAIMGLALTILLLMAVAALTVTDVIPAGMSDEYIICTVIIGSAFGGARCAKKMGSGVITAGLATAGLYLLIIIFGTIFTIKPEKGMLLLKVVLASLAGGAFGGVLRLYRKNKKSKIRRRI